MSGIGVGKVRNTVSEEVSGWSLIGSRLVWTTFWSANAAEISSSFSEMVTPNLTPLREEEDMEREHETALSASSICFSKMSCCSEVDGETHRSHYN